MIIREKWCDLKTLEKRAWRQDNPDSESVAMRNVFGGKVEIVLSASIIVKHSAVNEVAVGGKLLENEMYNFDT